MTKPKVRVAETGEAGIFPSVALPAKGLPGWLFLLVLIVAGICLFSVLNARRQNLNAPAVTEPRLAEAGTFGAAPALVVPPDFNALETFQPQPLLSAEPLPPPPPPPQQAYVPAMPQGVPAPPSAASSPPVVPSPAPLSPALIIDKGVRLQLQDEAEGTSVPGEGSGLTPPNVTVSRTHAGMFANPETTVAQGTLIPAVLESALDTSRGGFARAVTSQEVRSFDGSRVLIPRGSRLIGEVLADTKAAQKRALINWIRLIRPDGATISIGSPAADTLGGTGIRAKTDTHFFERFSGAILQSSLELGINLAIRETDAPTVIALPGSFSGAGISQPQQIPPTLTVKQGTSISVFVAQDLDFTDVEARK